ncbi:MAG: protein-disulfide reductase DsbD family protein [Verrucomicrobiales bacterium]
MLMPSVARSIALLMCTFVLFSPDRSDAQGPNFVNDPFAAATPPGEEVAAELVSEVSAVQPGTTFTVALKMVHSGPWHTYWENPGTGRPTQLNWTLPEGLTAGPIQWPVPEPKKDEIGTSNVYGGTAYLLTDIAVADNVAVGGNISIGLKANWLQCDEICTPGSYNGELKLPVVSEAPTPDAALKAAFDKVRAQQPADSDLIDIAIEDQGKSVQVKITPSGEMKEGKVHVYHLAKGVLVEPSAAAEKQGDSYVATFEKEEDAGAVTGLKGFAYAENGWGSDGTVVSVTLPEGGEMAVAASIPDADGAGVGEAEQPASAKASLTAVPTAMTPAEKAALDEVISWGMTPLGTKEEKKETLLPILGFAFLGGLILNLMPCVFPVLGIKIMGFVSQAGEDSKRIKMHGLAFGAGVLLSMWSLVIVLLLVKFSTGGNVVWGEQLRQPWFVAAMIAVIFAFGLSLAGLFEFGASLTTAGGQLQNKKGLSGSFFSGLLTVLIASPCTGPFMAPAISFAFNQSAAQTLLIFTVLGLGLASPYIVLSFFPALIQKLPRPGAWMETFKQFMAFPMLATVVWLVWVFGKQVGVSGIVGLLVGMLSLAFGLWIYGRFGTPFKKVGTRWAARITLLLAFTGSVYAVKHSIDNGSMSVATLDSSGMIDSHGMKWEPLTLERLVEHRKKGRTVFIDFTADW